MHRGDLTRQGILEHAAGLASRVGLEGLTIGRLAQDLDLSKSGLFAHFGSKEGLQIKVLEHAAARFTEVVIRPALAAPRGEPRLRALFERWRRWPKESGMPGGCFFVQAAVELDDRPGPARDLLVRQQKDWLDVIATVIRTALAEGHFRKDVEPEQLAFEVYGTMLAWHHAARLLRDARAEARARAAFEGLIARARR
ncbi:MAG TPA: TetR/AcrR family transcriptional regulator [Anaeromyxobacteraceae bacterium]|nr:TetR/AcrR family transcriptional regulator [Anaeromyxobacteraceae bacterium]